MNDTTQLKKIFTRFMTFNVTLILVIQISPIFFFLGGGGEGKKIFPRSQLFFNSKKSQWQSNLEDVFWHFFQKTENIWNRFFFVLIFCNQFFLRRGELTEKSSGGGESLLYKLNILPKFFLFYICLVGNVRPENRSVRKNCSL